MVVHLDKNYVTEDQIHYNDHKLCLKYHLFHNMNINICGSIHDKKRELEIDNTNQEILFKIM